MIKMQKYIIEKIKELRNDKEFNLLTKKELRVLAIKIIELEQLSSIWAVLNEIDVSIRNLE